MRVLFLNQYFPPDPAPTGILFAELAEECRRRNWEVDFVDAAQDYRGGQQKGGRMRRELAALRRMVSAGKGRPRADVVISGTSPPCLAVFADRVARHHRARHYHWAMDVYPEIAVALGEIRDGSLVAKITGWLMGRAYRRCAAVVALDSDMAARLRKYRIEPVTIRPWVFQPVLAQIDAATAQSVERTSQAWTWLYSGNLGRAHEYETLLAAQRELESRGADARLVFQGGGPSWAQAQARAGELGLKNCEWRSYVPEPQVVSSLLENDVLVVTQRPETQGLLWPSKLGLVSALRRPILFVGPKAGAIADELRKLPHAGVFAPGDSTGVADWLEARRAGATPVSGELDARSYRTEALGRWMTLLEPLAKKP